jgi:hypothetical protein
MEADLMVCRQCGREIVHMEETCTFCGAGVDQCGNELAASENLELELNQGFADPASLYEAPQVIEHVTRIGHKASGIQRDEISDIRQNNSKIWMMSDDIHEQAYSTVAGKPELSKLTKGIGAVKPEQSKQAKGTVTVKPGQSKRHSKKLTRQKQQRLYKELKARLHEEQQEALSRYMYQGLNQDVAEDLVEEQRSRCKDKSVILSLIGIIAGILLASLILLYVGSFGEATDYTFMGADAITVCSSQNERKTYVFNTRGDMLYKLNGHFEINYTPDHAAAILYNWNSREAVYVSAYRMKEFTTPLYRFALSDDGNDMIYSIYGGLDKYYLMHYDIRQNQETMLDLQEKYFDMLNILPGGKIISYITYRLSDEGAVDELQSHLVTNGGKPQLVGKDIFIFALSRDGSRIYYGEFADGIMHSLYMRDSEKEYKLSESLPGSIIFNQDYSEVLVGNEGGFDLFSEGNDKLSVLDHQIRGVLMPSRAVKHITTNGISRLGIRSFSEKLLIGNDNSIHYLDEKLLLRKLADTKGTETVTLSMEGSELFLLDTQSRLIKVSTKPDDEPEVWAEDVTEYRALRKLSQAYYIRNSNLYFKENNKEERLVSDNVHQLCLNRDKDTVFFLKDYLDGKGTLSYSKDGLPPVLVDEGINVTGLKEWNDGVIYQKIVNHSNAVFYNTEGTKFLFIMDGFDLIGESN